jgi:hypothetical protein
MNEKRPVGRPLITLEDLPKGWDKKLITMGKEGKFDVHVRTYLNMATDTFYRLLEDEPKFLEIVNRMRELSQEWWVNLPIESFSKGDSKNMNSQLYSLIMRNRFQGWNDSLTKIDITTQGEKIDKQKIEIEIIKKTLENDL